MVKELKKELSKLSGVDFFNPKYRDVFKKYFPDDAVESELNTDDAALDENIEISATDEVVEETKKDAPVMEVKEDKQADGVDEEMEEVESKADEAEAKEPEIDSGNVEEDEAGDDSTEEQKPNSEDASKELFETKVELELVKAGVREDRLEAAKRLFMSEITSLDETGKVKDMVKQYPEWIKAKPQAKPFGMPLTDDGDGLTAEERRLKEMGIDPRA